MFVIFLFYAKAFSHKVVERKRQMYANLENFSWNQNQGLFNVLWIDDINLLPVILHIHSFKLISRETYNGKKILTFSNCVMVFTWMGKLLSCHEIFGRNIHTHNEVCTYRSLHNFIIILYIVRHGKMMFAWPLAP